MNNKLASIVAGNVTPGFYRFSSRAQPGNLARQLEAAGWRLFHLQGAHIEDKASFLQASARAMHFPAYFGQNWDAFEESINDLAWAPAPGYVLLFDDVARFASQSPEQWATAYDILHGAITRWQQNGVPMIVLLRGTGSRLRELPRL